MNNDKKDSSQLSPAILKLSEENLQALIRIPSISDARGGNEGEVQRYMKGRFEHAGARVRELDVPADFYTHPMTHGPGRNFHDRPSIVAEMGPEDAPALLVLAHSDTVALFEPEAWAVDPFSGVKKDNAIWGLGAGDDKSGLAMMVAIASALAECGERLQRRVIFASTIDEESGVSNGMLILQLHGIRAEAALYLDGCDLDVCVGNLGGSVFFLHPSAAVSADELKSDHRALATACEQESERRSPLFAAPPFDRNAMRNASRLVFLRTHEAAGFLLFAFYTLPGEDREDTERELREFLGSVLGDRLSHYTVSLREPWFEPAAIPMDHWLPLALVEAVRDVTGEAPLITTVSKIDGFVLTNHAGIPCVSFGPCPYQDGSGRGAYHEPDERQPLPAFHAALQSVWKVVRDWANAAHPL